MAFKNDVADDMAPVGHSVWHRLAPSGPVGHTVWPPVRPPSGTPSGPVWPPVQPPSGTLVSSRGSGRLLISEPLDRCPFGHPTVALPYTYIKPSTPPLHHFFHFPICIGTCDYVATAALRGSWLLGAGSNCWMQTLSNFFPQFTQEKDGA
jgi:hypothetical protein